jgi:hypothetical protein
VKTKEELNEYRRRYYRKHRAEICERKRATYRGTHRDWWKRACVKAGVSPCELVNV